jgi:hypothetical protein
MIKSQTDFVTGLLFVAIGLFFSITGFNLEYGTPANMGPGFLPMTISAILVAIGLLQVVRGLRSPGKAVDFRFKQPAIICLSIVAFGFMLTKIGVLISILALMFASAYLHKNFTFKSFCIAYVAVVGIVLIFKLALRSNIPL